MREGLKNRKSSERSICLRGERGKLCEFARRPDAPDRSVSCHCIAFQKLLRHILVPPPVDRIKENAFKKQSNHSKPGLKSGFTENEAPTGVN